MLVSSQDAKKALELNNWPGNIRELSHSIERSVIICKEKGIKAIELGISQEVSKSEDSTLNFDSADLTLDELEKVIICERLKYFQAIVWKLESHWDWAKVLIIEDSRNIIFKG